ncbi:MAG: hypothetical protein JWQ40_2777 [Segetibacter sp.]|nr:hypothetical protein [Segetibacter sp.]
MKKIFFSYSRKDEKFALQLARDLQKSGVDIWIDQLHIRPSEPWDEEIEKGLEASNCLLVILSEFSIASDNVLNEINFALEEKKQVLPVIINSEIKKPFNVRRLQHIDFTSSYKEAFDKLLTALEIGVESKPLPAANDLNGKWLAKDQVNPFDKNDIYDLLFEFEIMGNFVFGSIKKTSVGNRYEQTKAFMEGKFNDGVISFYTIEQGWLGSETVTFKDFYYGAKKNDEVRFNLQSDRPWGFPLQRFTAKRQ